MGSLKSGDLKPGMVLRDAKKNVYLVVSKPSGKCKLLMLGADDKGPVLIDGGEADKWKQIELAHDKLDWGHFRDALLEWEFVHAHDPDLTLGQINKIFGTNVSLDDVLKRK
jgi:hypothetical protein